MDRKEYNKSKTYDRQQYHRERYLRLNPNKTRFKIKSDEERKKNRSITEKKHDWKRRGVYDNFNDNYKTLIKIYFSTKYCDNCAIELNTNTKTRKCLDHCHKSGYFRNILCHSCNVKLK